MDNSTGIDRWSEEIRILATNLKKIFFSAVTVSVLCALTGCDYIEEGKPESSLLKQQEEHNNKIDLLEKQQAQLKSQLETIQNNKLA